jgi:hypothetical protein
MRAFRLTDQRWADAMACFMGEGMIIWIILMDMSGGAGFFK